MTSTTMEREVTDGHGGHNALVLLLFSRGDVAARESSADQPYYAGPATIATTLYCLGRGRYGFLDLLSLSDFSRWSSSPIQLGSNEKEKE